MVATLKNEPRYRENKFVRYFDSSFRSTRRQDYGLEGSALVATVANSHVRLTLLFSSEPSLRYVLLLPLCCLLRLLGPSRTARTSRDKLRHCWGAFVQSKAIHLNRMLDVMKVLSGACEDYKLEGNAEAEPLQDTAWLRTRLDYLTIPIHFGRRTLILRDRVLTPSFMDTDLWTSWMSLRLCSSN